MSPLQWSAVEPQEHECDRRAAIASVIAFVAKHKLASTV